MLLPKTFVLADTFVSSLAMTFVIDLFVSFLDMFFCMQFSKYMSITSVINGDNEIRTHDPLLARQVLSHLSYTPGSFSVV